jgi:hypothetical protein
VAEGEGRLQGKGISEDEERCGGCGGGQVHSTCIGRAKSEDSSAGGAEAVFGGVEAGLNVGLFRVEDQDQKGVGRTSLEE